MSDDLLPSNATAPERALSSAVARLSDVPLVIRESWNPDTCPEHLLPWLAWAFSVDVWNTNWTTEQKRGAIRASVFVHRHKGTPAAMKAALDGIGYSLRLDEWFEISPPGDPYTFGVVIEIFDIGLLDVNVFDQIVDVANGAKNVRSHLNFVNIESVRRGEIFLGGVPLCGEVVTLAASDEPLFDSDLLDDAMAGSFEETEAAVDALHMTINTTLPAANYW